MRKTEIVGVKVDSKTGVRMLWDGQRWLVGKGRFTNSKRADAAWDRAIEEAGGDKS